MSSFGIFPLTFTTLQPAVGISKPDEVICRRKEVEEVKTHLLREGQGDRPLSLGSVPSKSSTNSA